MQFRLLYSGRDLTSNGSPSDKHALRCAFHPQLRRLWQTHPALQDLAIMNGALMMGDEEDSSVKNIEAEGAARYIRQLSENYQRAGFKFVPLVLQTHHLRVSLDILFLRPDQQPMIRQGGDLDNRLKTLFDALRMPDEARGLGGGPSTDEDPFYVLLHDDSLISEVRVNTDNLLMLPEKRDLSPADVFLVIDVSLAAVRLTDSSWAFR